MLKISLLFKKNTNFTAYRKTGTRDPTKTGKPGPYKNWKTGTLADLSEPYINATCGKNVLHKQHGQLGFHFLMFFLNSKDLDLLYFMVSKLKFLETRKM